MTNSIFAFAVYGLYVVDECNIETHGMKPSVGRLADDPLWHDAYLQRLQRMYWRDRNHACIVAWSLGNEAGYGAAHDVMAAWIRAQDASRVVLYEPASYGPRGGPIVTGTADPRDVAVVAPAAQALGPFAALVGALRWFWGEDPPSSPHLATGSSETASGATDAADRSTVATDVVCPMYARPEECIRLSKLFPHMPVIQCEYAHMMGTKHPACIDHCICVAIISELFLLLLVRNRQLRRQPAQVLGALLQPRRASPHPGRFHLGLGRPR